MSFCGTKTALLVAHGLMHAHKLYCRSWQCYDCFPKRLGLLKRMAESGKPSTFLTLTVNPSEGQSAEHRARELVDAMREMLRRAQKRFPETKIEYLAVFEETKRGEPHLHILMRAPFIKQQWISDTMNELIKAPIVHIERVTNWRRMGQYIAKYVSKGPKQFGSLKRYWYTRKYLSEQMRALRSKIGKPSEWRVVDESLENFIQSIARKGLEILELDTEHAVFAMRDRLIHAPP